MFFHCFQWEFGGEGYQQFSDCPSCMHVSAALLSFMRFTLNLKNKIAKTP